MLRATSVFQGCTIQARDGKAGHVSDVLFDCVSWKLRWLVVDTGGWAGGRLVLIRPVTVSATDGAIDRLYVDLLRQQILSSPGIFRDPPISQQLEDDFEATSFWNTHGSVAGSAPYAPLQSPSYVRSDVMDPKLRSAREIGGYHVHAVDGDIGHVLEFLLDDETWMIRYVILDTRNWLPGRHVMVEPSSVTDIDFMHRRVSLCLTREQLRDSPPAWEAESNNSYE